jgi:hypothetical protein
LRSTRSRRAHIRVTVWYNQRVHFLNDGMVMDSIKRTLISLFWFLCASANAADVPPDVHFIIGPRNAEDLVALGGGRWIIASGLVAGDSLKLIDVKSKEWIALDGAGPVT